MSDQIDTNVTKETKPVNGEAQPATVVTEEIKLLSVDMEALLKYLKVESDDALKTAIGHVRLAREVDRADKFELAISHARKALRSAEAFHKQHKNCQIVLHYEDSLSPLSQVSNNSNHSHSLVYVQVGRWLVKEVDVSFL